MSVEEYNKQLEDLFTEIKLLVDEVCKEDKPAWIKNANPQKNNDKISKNISKK